VVPAEELDGDLDGYSGCQNDCDDLRSDVNPGMVELCSTVGVDDDCNGLIDDADPGVSDTSTWYQDGDSDLFGDPLSPLSACSQPLGYVAGSTDCDDGNALVNPGMPEICDAADVDEDCNGAADDADPGVTATTDWYPDLDSDLYGDDTALALSQCEQPLDHVADNSDCDDSDPAVNPDLLWYHDGDADGFGDAADSIMSCIQPLNYVADNSDCDDGDAGAWTGETRYLDIDGDGYGDSTTGLFDCPSNFAANYVVDATDCRDDIAEVNPGALPNMYTVWDVDCSGTDDKSGQVVTTLAGTFTFDADSVNLFSDEEGDSTFAGGVSNWTVAVSTYGFSDPDITVGDFSYSTTLSGTYSSMEILAPVVASGPDNECLESSPVNLLIGSQYALCCNVYPHALNNEGLRLYTATDYLAGAGVDMAANVTISAGNEQQVCGAFTASQAVETLMICTGNWNSEPGAVSHCDLREGSF
jgi:hypothetical protein